MGRRGMSLEQKRQTLIRIITDMNRPMTMKEIEARGSKAGVVSQAIKEVVTELCDDNLIDFDKIGSTNLYWMFKSKAIAKRQSQIKRVTGEIEALQKNNRELESKVADLEKVRKPTDDRKKKLEELASTKDENAKMERQLETLRKNDPKKLKVIEDSIKIVKDGAVRWTDNMYSLQDHLKKKFGISSQDAAKQLGMTSTFDYPVYAPPAKKQKKK